LWIAYGNIALVKCVSLVCNTHAECSSWNEGEE